MRCPALSWAEYQEIVRGHGLNSVFEDIHAFTVINGARIDTRRHVRLFWIGGTLQSSKDVPRSQRHLQVYCRRVENVRLRRAGGLAVALRALSRAFGAYRRNVRRYLGSFARKKRKARDRGACIPRCDA
jgi:hypothetical protein